MITSRYYRPLARETIINILQHVRAEIVRDELDGLEHVDALLWLYGVDPEARPIAQKRPRVYRRMGLRKAVRRSLAGGPKTTRAIALDLLREKNSITYEQAYERAYACCYKLMLAGDVVKEKKAGRVVWSLPPPRSLS